MTTRSLTWTPPRYKPRRLLIFAAVCLGLCWWAMRSSSNAVATATRSIPPGGGCQAVWIGWVGGCRGIVLLELAGSRTVAEPIVARIRGAGVSASAVRSVELDYLLIICYVGLLALAASAVADLDGVWQIRWLRRTLLAVALLQVVAGTLDGLENVGLFTMLEADVVADNIAYWTFWISAVKWWLIGIGIVVPLLAFGVGVISARWRLAGS